jgi:hypothetical protein
MSETAKGFREVEEFVRGWREEAPAVKGTFERLLAVLRTLQGVACTFTARPGVSYSLRPRHCRQQDRDFFMILDVIDDDPAARWLSVCFYADLITDPEGRGEVIPGGLAGSDGYCFDLYSEDEDLVDYLEKRCLEAWESAKAGG